MAAKPESQFPTIADARDVLQRLVDKGLGELPVQVLVVPASTLALLAKDAGHTGSKPALMIEMSERDGAEMGILITSAEAMASPGLQ